MPLRDLHHRIFRRLFKGRSVREFDCSFPSYFAKVGDSLHNQPACARLRAAQEAGHHVVIISSSAGFIVAPHARRLGVAEFYTTEYAEDAQGLLSHMVHLVEGTDKARILLEVAQRLGVSRDRTYAYSDSHIDLPFLEAAGTPVGVSPDRILRQTCLARGWEVLN